jgi:hypothetical protein
VNECSLDVLHMLLILFLICKSVFLDFVHRLHFNKITFRKLDFLLSSCKKGKTEILAVGLLG